MTAPIKPRLSARKSGGRTIESRDLLQEYIEKDMSRRRLLMGSLAAATVAMGCSDAGNPTTPPVDGGANVPADSGAPVDVPPARMTHLVGAGQSDDHVAAANLALQETTGFDFVQSGQRVYLKINTNSGDAFPYSTSPDMIRWVTEKVRERGGEVFVGDRSFFGDRNTGTNFRRNGIADICEELGVELTVFGDPMTDSAASSVDWMDLPGEVEGLGPRSAFWTGTMRIPTMVAQADHIVAMPCVKTHFISSYTMTMKNMIGIINPRDRSLPNNLGNHSTSADKLHRQVAFMNKAGPNVSLVVLDGWTSLISGGPLPSNAPPRAPAGWTAQTEDAHVVIISRDRVAADLTGLALLKTLSPMYEVIQTTTARANRQMMRALASGVGISSVEQLDLSGPSVTAIEMLRTIATA
ncbi:MAG: DUF362 domain-containing protein [Deltaproteobacteria bacterium]|nr:DUF362 domain-containing protein [Myxococcales bacterium]MDP3217104.1 DUF362 domain-containing protein [Deltaproteobacteria bacterium]